MRTVPLGNASMAFFSSLTVMAEGTILPAAMCSLMSSAVGPPAAT